MMMIKSNKDSFILQFNISSKMANTIFDKYPMLRKDDSRYSEFKPIVVLQVMSCGEEKLLAEVMWKEDFDKIYKQKEENKEAQPKWTDEEIKLGIGLGDEVVSDYGSKGVVVGIDTFEGKVWLSLLMRNHKVPQLVKMSTYKTKTGRHFPQIIEVLEQIKEEKMAKIKWSKEPDEWYGSYGKCCNCNIEFMCSSKKARYCPGCGEKIESEEFVSRKEMEEIK